MFQPQDAAHPPAFKMNGCGNDFVVFDARESDFLPPPEACRAIASRRSGPGCDQILVVAAGAEGSDAAMLVRNADGSPAAACGNGARCVALLLAQGEAGRQIVLDAGGRRLLCRITADGEVCVDMGAPAWGAEAIRLSVPLQGGVWLDPARFAPPMPAAADIAGAVSMGNPHAVFFLASAEALNAIDLAAVGPALEHHAAFPDRANISFAHVRARDAFDLRVWERGAGATQCCGTAACAAHALAARRGLCDAETEAHLPGGVLRLRHRREDGHILMTGPAALDAQGLDLAEQISCAPRHRRQTA